MQSAASSKRFESRSDAFAPDVGLSAIIGKSAVILVEVEKARRYARCEAAVLITGESGTGKEVFARAIPLASDSLVGITEFGLGRQSIDPIMADVQQALDELVKFRLVLRIDRLDGSAAYSLRPEGTKNPVNKDIARTRL